MTVTLGELAREIGGELHNGDPACLINAVATLQHAGEGDISFLANKGYRKFLRDTRASAVILAPAEVEACPTAAIVLDNPYAGYARAAALLVPARPDRQGIHPQACIDPDSRVDPAAWVGPHCCVEAGAVIHAGVQLASGCRVGAGSVIGIGVVEGREVLVNANDIATSGATPRWMLPPPRSAISLRGASRATMRPSSTMATRSHSRSASSI